MPARRFWMLERQIDRIRAENDLRDLQAKILIHPAQSPEQFGRVEEYVGRLTLEIGERATLRRNVYVAPEQDARDKFARIMGG